MRRLSILLLTLCLTLTINAQTYHNPVIAGFHPDPSVCRVGDRFYLVNSSFQYFPGVPLYESRDLVHWRLVTNVLSRASQLPLKGADSWTGIYAPTIRYNNGTFYMITTNLSGTGNFLVTSRHPEGPWSEPVKLSQGGIDPSLYFENGRCYMVSNPGGGIKLCEIDPQTGRQLTESREIWRGTGGRYPEGPHVYKKDGYYYLLISEGGTELAHSLTIARSRDIYGPYEPNPDNPILTNCRQAGQNKQLQGTGHGDFVQAQDGSWWLVFLAYRNMGGSYHHLGRETCLAPVSWEKDQWPVVYGGQPVDTLMQAQLLPQKPYALPIRDQLRPGNPIWVYVQNPDSSKYQWNVAPRTQGCAVGSLNKNEAVDEGIRLYGSASTLTENRQPTFIGRRQEAERITCAVQVACHGGTDFEAGLTVYQTPDAHYDLYVSNDKNGLPTVFLRYELKGLPHNTEPVATLDKTMRDKPVTLRVVSKSNRYYFEYATDGKTFRQADSLPCTLLSTEVAGGFTGVILGMFATGKGYADFSNWDYRQE